MQVNFDELKVTSRLLAQEAISRGWAVEVLDYRLGLLEYYDTLSGKKVIFKGTNGPFTRTTDTVIADDKVLSAQLAAQLGLMVPETVVMRNAAEAQSFLHKHKKVVVKPLDSAHGNGITLDVATHKQLEDAIVYAGQYADVVLVQQQVSGGDLRVLCIGGKAVAVTRRHPAAVVGDGMHTVSELIDIENSSGERAADYKRPLNFINKVASEVFLGAAINDVPIAGQSVQVVGMVNIGMGGKAENIAGPQENVRCMAESLAQRLQLAVCGVDFLVTDDADNTPYFIELNGNPSFGLHVYPAIGESVPVHKIYWDWLEDRIRALP